MPLQTILDNVEVRTYQGRFRVQLEIPPWSTLTEEEIQEILEISSWDRDLSGYYTPGGRSLHMKRENPIKKGSITLGALQINGVGCIDIEEVSESGVVTFSEKTFSHPHNGNFMEGRNDGFMGTSFAQGKEIVHTTPDYRPTGTYSTSELNITINNTLIADNLGLTILGVPHVEAYGRYLEDELRSDDGYFGFVVLPIPQEDLPRFSQKLVDELVSVQNFAQLNQYQQKTDAFFATFAEGLREFHDSGYVHLQTHSTNLYNVFDYPYLMDWTTMQPLGKDREENALNRAIDILRPCDNVGDLVFHVGCTDEQGRAFIKGALFVQSLAAYLNLDLREMAKNNLENAAKNRYGGLGKLTFCAEYILHMGVE